ncbi:MAG: hypothetical protein ACR2ID_08150 [Chthoniobacterales bacterium]
MGTIERDRVANESKPPRTIALIVSAIRNLSGLPFSALGMVAAAIRFTEPEPTLGALVKADMFSAKRSAP